VDAVSAAGVPGLVRVARESRLLQFLVAGGLIFAVAPRAERSDRIELSREGLAALHAAGAQKLGGAQISPVRAEQIDRRAVEDEVLYREAVRLGLDQDDGIVRQHLVQKVLMLAEDLDGATRDPGEAELRRYYEETRERWRKNDVVHLLHVFAVDHDRVQSLGEQLAAYDGTPGAPPLGDAFPHSRELTTDEPALAGPFGERFASAVFALPAGTWSEPLQSTYGWHRVKVLDHQPGRTASFAEVRERLSVEYAVERRHRAIRAFLAQAYQRYHLELDGADVPFPAPGERLAFRSSSSVED
jgi:peptidyl-prolyl cis-trans isomerase C